MFAFIEFDNLSLLGSVENGLETWFYNLTVSIEINIGYTTNISIKVDIEYLSKTIDKNVTQIEIFLSINGFIILV